MAPKFISADPAAKTVRFEVGTWILMLAVALPAAGQSSNAVAPTFVQGALAGSPYAQTLAAVGTAPITWSITSGALPPGLVLGTSTGIISGTPTTAGVYNFLATAANPGGSASQQLTLAVNVPPTAPSIVTRSLSTAVTGSSYSQTVTATGSTPITWAVTTGALPPGLSLGSSTGIISGTPTASGAYTFTLSATNAGGSSSVQLSLTANAPVTVSVTPSSISLLPSQSQTFTAAVAGSSNTGVTWSFSPALGSLATSATTAVYVAPGTAPVAQVVTVTATSVADPSKTAVAAVTLLQSVTVSISPSNVTLASSGTQQLSATVLGTSNTAVTWSINPPVGTISAGGLYTAPASVSASQTVNVTAQSVADATKSASASISLTPTFTYYVDSVSGSDSNPGTQALPWQTLGKVNATALLPGQSVGFKSGSVWRGQALVPGQSGTAGNPIAFGAYGTGPAPQILGSVGANTASAWQAASIPFSASGSVARANMKLSISAGHALVDFGPSASLTNYIGGKLTITDSAGHTLTGYIGAAGTGETYGSQLLPDPGLDTISTLTFYGANGSILTNGCLSGSCLIVTPTLGYGRASQAFAVSNGMLLKSSAYVEKGTESGYVWTALANQNQTQLVTLTIQNAPTSWLQYSLYGTVDSTSATFYQQYEGDAVGNTTLFDSASVTQVLTPSTTGVTIVSTSGGLAQNWASEQTGFNRNDSNGYTYTISGSGFLPNIWQSTGSLTTAPNAVFRDNLPLAKVSSANALSTTGQYYYANGAVYVYATGNPTGASDRFEITQGTGNVTSDALVNLANKNYVTVSGLNLAYANLNGILINTSNNIIVNGVNVSCTWGTGVQNLGWASDFSSFITVENSIFNWNGGGGIRFAGGGGASAYGQLHDLFIQANTVTYAGWQTTVSTTTGGIYVWGVYGGPSVSYNATIENNNVGFTLFGPGNTGNAAGIYMDEWGTGGVIRYNSSHDNAGPGIEFEHQSGNSAYYNLLWNNATSPAAFPFQFVFYRSTSNMLGANNTCYGGINCYGVVGQSGAGQAMIGNTLENNIALGYSGMALQALLGGENANGGSGNAYVYNGFGPQANNFIGWGSATYFATYSAWETAMGSTSHSLEVNPLLVNPPADMSLMAGSPAIGAGVYIPGVNTTSHPNIGAK